jgi:hypothetical protein
MGSCDGNSRAGKSVDSTCVELPVWLPGACRRSVALLSVTVGGFIFSSVPALAAGPPEAPETKPASAVAATTAMLNGVLNPGAAGGAGTYEYLYRASATECEGGSVAPEPAGIALGLAKEPVSTELMGLTPHTQYAFCLLARNAAEETTIGPAVTFTTSVEAPMITEESVTEISSSSATFNARINPGGADTKYRFEYGASGENLPVPDGEGDVGEGTAGVVVSVHIQEGLLPKKPYHFRVVATNSVKLEDGEDRTFTTQASGGQLVLPDGRAWEMVSPPNKNGAGIEPIFLGALQASEDGNAITYVADAPIVTNPQGGTVLDTQVISTRSSGGWSSQDISTPHNAATGGNGKEYEFFSSDLSLGLVEPLGSFTGLSPEATESTAYLRTDYFNGDVSRHCQSSCFLPLVTVSNTPPGTAFGEEPNGNCESSGHCGPSFLGATPDLSHVVLSSRVSLTSPPSLEGGLYEWAAGQLQLVSVLPTATGKPATGRPTLGDNGTDVRHAISSDGSRIVWSESGGEHHLYLRDSTNGETVQLDTVQSGSGSGPVSPRFQTASSDGARIFFTDEQQLTAGSTAKELFPDLYEYEVTSAGGPLAGKLIDLTEEVKTPGESADVQGVVLGAGEDGSDVYFVANGDLASGVVPGNNLYTRHYNGKEWTPPTFIAALSGEDANDWASTGTSANLGAVTSRVSPNGRYLAFMSDRSLTGYDNTDANSGQSDEEVFLYDASLNHLICASCNPTGARPVGVFDSGNFNQGGDADEGAGLLIDRLTILQGRWLAGSIPGWTPITLVSALYQSRYLSDNGRLFFDSADALVPQDVNGLEDVYEYEPEGVGSCTNSSEIFSEKSSGCVGLISSGTSSEESAFLDASAKGGKDAGGNEGGGDVFFLTASKLAPQDLDTSFDVYDAHECSEAVPCFAPSPVAPPPCSTGDSCKPAPSSQPGIFGPSGSATFSGAANLTRPSPKPPVKPRSLTLAQKLAKVLKACRRARSGKRERASCEAQARKRYGAKTTPKKSNEPVKKGRK